jgi:RNA polymerase sigma factor (sigma-70 family)
MSRVKAWMAKQTENGQGAPSMEEIIREFDLNISPVDLHVAMWAVSNPRGEGTISVGGPYAAGQDEDSGRFDLAAEVDDERESRHDIERMKRAMKRLTPIERAAVVTYGGEAPPLRVVGEEHGISREWVNQTRKKAIRTLRMALRVRDLDS